MSVIQYLEGNYFTILGQGKNSILRQVPKKNVIFFQPLAPNTGSGREEELNKICNP